MKATEQFFPVVLFFMLYKVVLTFQFANGIQNYDAKIKLLLVAGFLLQCHFLERYSSSPYFRLQPALSYTCR